MQINYMLTALFHFFKKRMKKYSDDTILFRAKILVCALIWIYVLPLTLLLERGFRNINIIYNLPHSLWAYLPILLLMYFILNHFTWKLKEVDSYLADEENEESIKKAKRLFFILLVLGFIFLIAVAKYNQGNPHSD